MKTKISKSIKRILGIALALCILMGSLFTANVGVGITASAATVEDTWDGTKVEPTQTDASGNIIISTAEELAWIILQGGTATQDKNYKVVANAVFNMNGMSGITLDSTATQVQSATKDASKLWVNGSNYFMGNFDGNGLIVYNVNGKGDGSYAYSGFFSIAKQTADGDDIVIKNIEVRASYFTGFHNVGAVIGLINAPGTSCTATLENLAAVNCYVSDNGNANAATQRTISTIAGGVGHSKVTMNNCFASGNTLSAANIVGGLIGNTSAYSKGVAINNSLVIGSSAIPVELLTTDTHPLQSPTANATYTNVYTDQTVSKTGVTVLTTANMTGANAVSNMALDFSGVWFANTSGVPELRLFHTIAANNNGNGTHSEYCADCNLVGLTQAHFYNNVDDVNMITSCVCGAAVNGIFDVWDSQGAKANAFAGGSGTESDPYIIKTVEQLFLMVRSTGIDANGKPIYYKVADGVTALYINDTRNFADQAAFEAAVGTLKNWSTGLTTEAQLCGDTANCYSEHYNDVYKSSSTKVLNNHRDGYVDYFGGRFDGNGTTIYGLYSQTTAANHWNNGVGFVPMLTGDAVIKNVTFDTNYVKSNSANAAVITATVGIWDGQYNKDTDGNGSYETFVMCPEVDAYAKRPANCNAAILNVAVRNTYLNATNYSSKSYVSGFVSSIRTPKSMKFDSCLFDGTNSTFVDTATGTQNHVAFVTTQETNTNSILTGCVSVSNETLTSYETNSVFNCHSVDSNEFAIDEAPMINWSAWETVDGKPTPKYNESWTADSYKNQGDYQLSWFKNSVLTSTDAYTGYDFSALRDKKGIFNAYDTLVGGGTEADPYIISDANTLYMIIASGGTHRGIPQHFELACDIDLGGKQWVDTAVFENTTYGVVFYQYAPFAGTIDGAGHTITGLYTAREGEFVGFIPELAETGVVKNLHFRDCYAYSGVAYGIIVGYTHGGEIINCSVADSTILASELGGMIGYYDDEVNITDCQSSYYDGYDLYNFYYPTAEDELEATDITVDGTTWYVSGGEDCTPKLVNKADAMPYADVDGDGYGYSYGANDVTALKSYLLGIDGYENIYGDVSRNGKIDMRDLSILQRDVSGDEIAPLDGFWRAMRAGKFEICYDENDNYDSARMLQLYFKEAVGVNVGKSIKATDSKFDIVVKTDTSLGANNYSIAYNIDNAILTISGGSFTAVEQAVIDFIANSNPVIGFVHTGTGTLATEKQAIEVKVHSTSNDNGSLSNSSSQVSRGTYHYVWGDEFNTDVNGTISYDKWFVRDKGSEGTEFKNLKLASDSLLPTLNAVSGGKLTMNRGLGSYSGDSGSKDSDGNVLAFDSNDMASSGVLTSAESLLFKRGYMELKAVLPNDANAFPAWWLLTNPSGRGNRVIDNSLYSKVFEINNDFDGSQYYSADNYKTYKYKLPTNYFEIDLLEIINNPNSGSKRNAIWYNLHKWYSNCFTTADANGSFKVYDLAWDKLAAGAISDFDEQAPLLTMTYNSSTSKYTASNATINYHVTNSQSGQINAAINQFGTGTNVSQTYGGFNGEEPSWWDKLFGATQETYDVNMGTVINSADTVTEYIYGFLWTEEEMSYIIKDANGNLLVTVTIDLDDLGYDEGPVLPEQYAYFLIDNHFYTKDGAKISHNGQMIIDYVRLYQLDGERDIVTPETERNDVQSR